MSSAFLLTKLGPPPAPARLVKRPFLIAQMNAGLDGKLNLISAPAGYGKTTLVAEWLKQLPAEYLSGWLSLDDSDNDPARFLSYLIAALQQIHPGLAEAARGMLQAAQPPPGEVILTVLVNDIAALTRPVILVLDDYHLIHTRAIHQQVAFLLEHQPASVHLVLITREDPLLPVPRLRARGQVLEIRQHDLRFTPAECADFLQHVMGLVLDAEDIEALERRTEGWIAGLQLAALSMRGQRDLKGFVQAFTGSSRFILDYLIEEVFEGQQQEVKEFLLKTSILERLSGPLCDALVAGSLSQDILETLERANLFIVPLGQSREWYRYHHLFAELLRNRLRLSGYPEGDLHGKASLWFEQNGYPAEAVQHAVAARNWPRAAGLLKAVTADLLKRGEAATLVRWYGALPQEMLLADPDLSFNYAWPLLLAGQYETAAPLLERAENMAQQMPEFLGEVLAGQAYLARALGDHALMIERSQRALQLLSKSSVNTRAVVAVNLGLSYWHMGKMAEAETALAEAIQTGQASSNYYAVFTALIFQGRILAVRGQLRQAAGYFERVIEQGGHIPINALAHLDLSTLLYEWNELAESDRHLQNAIEFSQRAQNSEFLVACWMMQSCLRLAQGDAEGAQSALENAWALVHSGKIPAATAARVDVAQVRFLLAQGKAAEAQKWADKITDKVDSHPFYRFLGLTKARILPVAHARVYLNGLGAAAQTNGWQYGLMAVRLFQALFAEKQAAALEFLGEALHLAQPHGCVRTFVEAGEALIPLLHEAARLGIAPGFVGRILEAMPEKPPVKETSQGMALESLSEREMEVLRLVSAGLSNREIAEKLFISPGTAKSHIHNLCGKLGVRNRTEAAMRAKELGWV